MVFYRTAGGAEPVRDWLRALPIEDRQCIGHDLAQVQFGWPVGMPVCRALGEGLWEVRSTLPSRRIARTLFFYSLGRIGVLHGFVKKTRKTPPEDIALARKRMKEMASLRKSSNPHWGSTLDDFLQEEGIYEQANATAIKRVIAWQLSEEMKKKNITKKRLAELMHTSRAQVDRILDPLKGNVTIETLQHAASLLGRRLRLELV